MHRAREIPCFIGLELGLNGMGMGKPQLLSGLLAYGLLHVLCLDKPVLSARSSS